MRVCCTVLFVVCLRLAAFPADGGFRRMADGSYLGAPELRLDSTGISWRNGYLRFTEPSKRPSPQGSEPIAETWYDYSRSSSHPRIITHLDFQRIRYADVWPGISVEFYVRHGNVEFDIIAQPGADLTQIGFEREANADLSVDSAGGLWDRGQLFAHAPVISTPGSVSACLRLTNSHAFSINVRGWDGQSELRIDPLLALSVYLQIAGGEQLGSRADDRSLGIFNTLPSRVGGALIAKSGVIVMAGSTNGYGASRWPFIQAASRPGQFTTAFIASRGVNSVTAALLAGDSTITAIAEHPAGGYVVAGFTSNSSFPLTPGAYRPASISANTDYGFITRISADFKSLTYSAIVDCLPFALAIDPSGDVVVAGNTMNGKPYTNGAYHSTNTANSDVAILKLKADGSDLRWAAIFGGAEIDTPWACAIDRQGNVLVAGDTASKDLKWPAPSLQPSYVPDGPISGGRNDADGFVLRLSSDGTRLLNGTYFGGSKFDVVRNIHVTADDSLLISGMSLSQDFPRTSWIPAAPGGLPGYLDVHGFTALVRADLGAMIWGNGWSRSPLIESALSADQILYAIASSSTLPHTEDAYDGTDALYQQQYSSHLVAADARSGRWLYSSSTGRFNPYNQLAPAIAVGPGGMVAVAGTSTFASFFPVYAPNPAAPGDSSSNLFVQLFQFGDASPVPAHITIHSMTPGASTASGQIKISGQRAPVQVSANISASPAWLRVDRPNASLGQAIEWSANPSGLAPGAYQYSLPLQPTGGVLAPAAVRFDLFVDSLLPQTPQIDVTASAQDSTVVVPLRVEARFGLPFEARSDQPWLLVCTPAAVSPAEITLRVSPAGLTPGSVYQARLTLTPNRIAADAVIVPVTLRVN